uniref:hypothetical protein n=1 Tax=Scytonema sp. HK-05 TaxID=1137095 RepID=UPI0030D8E359
MRGDSWFIDSPLDSRFAPTAQEGKSRLRDVPGGNTVLSPNFKMLMEVLNFQIKKYPATSCGGRHLVGN